MTRSELEQYREYVSTRLGGLSPLLENYAVGDFSESIQVPDEEDEFTELLVGLTLMVDDIREMMQEREDTIASLQRAGEAIRRQRQEFLAIVGSVPEMVYVADPATYEVLFANRALVQLLDGDPVGRVCYEAFQGLDAPCDFCTNAVILRERKPYTWEYHNPMLDKDFLITDQIIKWPDDRDVRFEVASDITERVRSEEDRRRVEEALRESEEKHRNLFENADVGMFRSRLDGTAVLAANRKAAQIVGLSLQEVLSNPAFIRWQNPADRQEMVRRLGQEEFVSEYEIQVVAGNGEIKTCLLSGRVFGDALEGSLVDVTRRKRAEQELAQRVEELERFNRLAVGRELRMIELKRQVNALSEQLGKAPPYDLSFVESGGQTSSGEV